MNFKLILFGAIAFIFLGIYLLGFYHTPVQAKVEKITWCHVEPNGNQETLHLPLAALINAGHVSAQGNPLHAGDHAGECVEATPTPSCTPTPTLTGPCDGEGCVLLTPSPTGEVSPTPTDEPKEPTPTAPPAGHGDGLSDGKSDGRSDGRSSSPQNSPFDNQPVGWK